MVDNDEIFSSAILYFFKKNFGSGLNYKISLSAHIF